MKRQRISAFITAGLMCLACISGQNIKPVAAETGKGDVNGDGALSVADVILLQKWLHAVPIRKRF